MRIYVLDTTTPTLLQRKHPRVSAALAAHAGDAVVVSSVSVEEALGGWYARIRQAKTPAEEATASRLLADTAMLIGRFQVVPLTEPAIARYQGYRRSKLNVSGNDLRIAAIAQELGATVATNNTRDFGRVPGLMVEDWSV